MLVALSAYIIDRVFGEFPVRHPVCFIGDFVSWFEGRFWRDSVFFGAILTVSAVFLFGGLAYSAVYLLSFLDYYVDICVTAVLSSMFLASKSLYDAVKGVLGADDKRAALSMLVSRDTEVLDESGINKALIETYAENLSDGVVAPLFYLSIFGFVGIVVYKTINTLDSMVGYRTKRYEKFGKFAAKADDILNLIPSRLTAVLICVAALSVRGLKSAFRYGGGHESPNAGYPIAAMAGALGVRLGGDTSYHGKIKKKPYFGDGRGVIGDGDVIMALRVGRVVDLVVILILIAAVLV